MKFLAHCATLSSLVAWPTAHNVSGPVPSERQLFSDLPLARDEDFQGLSIFIYELPKSFNADLHEEAERQARGAGSNCDWMRSPCTESQNAGRWSVARQMGHEVIILRKLLASPNRVTDPMKADLFVVPYLVATACRTNLNLIRCGHSLETWHGAEALFSHLDFYSPSTRHRHLFLASADMHSLPLVVQAQSLLASLGAIWARNPGHFVVPSAVTDRELQPSLFNDQSRDILFFLALVPNNLVRFEMWSQLTKFDQTYPEEQRRELFGIGGSVRLYSFGRTAQSGQQDMPSQETFTSLMQRSLLCPCPPGENSAAGTKRLFDSILSGCIPVVLSFETILGSRTSWWRRNGAPIEWSLPFPWEIDWKQLVIEVPENIFFGDANNTTSTQVSLATFCLNLGLRQIEARRDYLLKVRQLLLYDFAGGHRDAFSVLMDGIRTALPKLAPFPHNLHMSFNAQLVSPSHPLVCHYNKRDLKMTMVASHTAKLWSHTFGEISCIGVHLWLKPELIWKGQAVKLVESETQAVHCDQFTLHQVTRTQRGTIVIQQVRSLSILKSFEQSQAALSGTHFSVCMFYNFPCACHDTESWISSHRLCHEHEIDRPPPITSCHLLPASTPRFLQERPLTFLWEAVVHVCNYTSSEQLQELGEELDYAWRKMPRGHALQIVVYDACKLDDSAGVASHKYFIEGPQSQCSLDHVLTAIFDKRAGRAIPDALIVLHHLDKVRPMHVMNTVVQRCLDLLQQRATWDEPVQHWLLGIGSHDESIPDEHGHMCDAFVEIFSGPCPFRGDLPTPPALVFTTDLLSNTSLAAWEVAATFIRENLSWSLSASLMFLLLYQAVVFTHDIPKALFLYDGSLVSPTDDIDPDERSLSMCIADYEKHKFWSFSTSLASGNDDLREQAVNCTAVGATYAVVESGLPFCLDLPHLSSMHSSTTASWRSTHAQQVRRAMNVLGTIGQEAWRAAEVSGICVPLHRKCEARHVTAVAWHQLFTFTIGVSEQSKKKLPPVPDNARVRLWVHSENEAADLFGKEAPDRFLEWQSEFADYAATIGK